MPSHKFNYPKVVPVVAGPSPHREDDDDGKAPQPARDRDDDEDASPAGR